MDMWKTRVELDGVNEWIPIRFKRGLYQRDSLSPLLFCLCVVPLSEMLRCSGGFRSEFQQEPLTHLSFMDDLKCYEERWRLQWGW